MATLNPTGELDIVLDGGLRPTLRAVFSRAASLIITADNGIEPNLKN